jgi:hypothetical protein
MPVMEALLPVNSPEITGSLLAAGADEENCQLPVTAIAFAAGSGVKTLEQPARNKDVGRRTLAPATAARIFKALTNMKELLGPDEAETWPKYALRRTGIHHRKAACAASFQPRF